MSKLVALDIETTDKSPKRGGVSLVQLASRAQPQGSIIDAFRADPTPLLRKLENVPTIAHNAKFEISFLRETYGVELSRVRDTMLMDQVLTAGDRPLEGYSLESLVARYLPDHEPLDKTQQKSDWSQRPLTPEQLEYAAEDAAVLVDLYDELCRRLDRENLLHVADLENRVVPYTAMMETTGVRFDAERWASLEAVARERRAALEEEMRAMVPKRPSSWNLNSPKDIKTLLDAVGVNGTDRTSLKSLEARRDEHPLVETVIEYKEAKSRGDDPVMEEATASATAVADALELEKEPWNFRSWKQVIEIADLLGAHLDSTGEEELVWFVKDFPFFAKLLEWREQDKRISTYGANWAKDALDEDGRIYPSYHQMGTDTGRYSSSAPNWQNIPKTGGYRECFVADPGYTFVIADYSQIELRILASITGDEDLLWAFAEGHDPHRAAAMGMAGKDSIEAVTDPERGRAKQINFGLPYGLTGYGLMNASMKQFGPPMDREEAESYIRDYFAAHPAIEEFQREIEADVAAAAEVGIDCYTSYGRRRIGVTNKREAFNMPIQGLAGDGLKEAQARLYEDRHKFPRARPWLTLHDAIGYTCPIDEAEAVEAWIIETMKVAMDDVVNSDASGAENHYVPIEVKSYIDTRGRSE